VPGGSPRARRPLGPAHAARQLVPFNRTGRITLARTDQGVLGYVELLVPPRRRARLGTLPCRCRAHAPPWPRISHRARLLKLLLVSSRGALFGSPRAAGPSACAVMQMLRGLKLATAVRDQSEVRVADLPAPHQLPVRPRLGAPAAPRGWGRDAALGLPQPLLWPFRAAQADSGDSTACWLAGALRPSPRPSRSRPAETARMFLIKSSDVPGYGCKAHHRSAGHDQCSHAAARRILLTRCPCPRRGAGNLASPDAADPASATQGRLVKHWPGAGTAASPVSDACRVESASHPRSGVLNRRRRRPTRASGM